MDTTNEENKDKYNGGLKQRQISAHMGWGNYDSKIWAMYIDDKLSGNEIAEIINDNTPRWLTITARSITRRVQAVGKNKGIDNPVRPIKEAFNLAIKRNRVQWAWKSNKIRRKKLNPKLRYKILQRDGFKCVKCGNTAETSVLEVDHIKRVRDGGTSEDSNLRTLCHECNFGRG